MSVALLASVLLFTATSSPALAPVVSPQLLVGKWRIENSGLYFFHADGTWECRVADMIDAGRWKLRNGHTLDLLTEHFQSKTTHDVIVIDRVVHETLYVRTRYGREVWLKQPGP
jgi:hypothetical protein